MRFLSEKDHHTHSLDITVMGSHTQAVEKVHLVQMLLSIGGCFKCSSVKKSPILIGNRVFFALGS